MKKKRLQKTKKLFLVAYPGLTIYSSPLDQIE